MPMISMTRRHALFTGAALISAACSGRPDARAETQELSTNWRLGPALPFAVQEIYPTLHQGQIHLAGGFISDGDRISGVTDRHIALDLEKAIWTDLTSLPTPRHHPNLVSFQDHLMAIGGFQSEAEDAAWVMQSSVWAYNGIEWRDAPSLPQPNGESVTGILDGQLHVCGGRAPKGKSNANWNDHSDIGDHFVLPDLNESWVPAAPLPTPRNSAAAATIGDHWHVVGGRTVSDGNTPAHEVYDTGEDRWRTAAPMPQGQGGLAAASLDGVLFAFGGEFFDNGGGVYPEAWAYDPARDTWDALPNMPNPRHGLGAVTLKGEIYVIGGALSVGGQNTSNLVEVFKPS